MKYLPVLCLLSVLLVVNTGHSKVVIHDVDKVSDCYRLISSRNLEAAHLLNPKGRYVHTWYHPQLKQPKSDVGMFDMSWHYAEMLPNGHLIAIIKDEMIIELDWNSNLVWQQNLRAHHDFARTANDHTLVVSRQDVDDPWNPGKKIAMDRLVEFDAKGEQIWVWRYEDHMQEIESLVDQPLPPDPGFRDWPHINTCEVLPKNPIGQKDSRFSAGNILLCGRHANTIFIVEKRTGQIVWAWGPGELQGPHMPTMLDNGHILIYDNGYHMPENARGYTRIIELDPLTGEIVWEYTASPPKEFYSPSRGSANRLKNGNTLIAESDSGHLIEVDTHSTTVWEYWNSDLKQNGKRMALYRTVPYDKTLVDSLLNVHGHVKDVIPAHEETLEFPDLGPDLQYKRFIREVVFCVETGYFDHAFDFLDRFRRVFPHDPEADYGYSLLYCAKRNLEQSFDSMQKALSSGLPLSRFTCGLTHLFDPLLNHPEYKQFISSQEHTLVHGPMLGDITHTHAKIWARTYEKRPVQVVARKKGNLKFNIRSNSKVSDPESESTAILTLEGLKPETVYEYKVIVDGKPGLIHSFKTYAKPGQPVRFKTGFGGGAGYTPRYERMWDTLHSHRLPFFLFLGDNVYIDHPERPAVQQFCYYRRQSRPEFREFAANTALYAIWDDHDFTFNDGKGSPYPDRPRWKKSVWNLFQNQWNNPYYGGGDENPGCWFDFSYGDVDFFMLDCRYYREQPQNNPNASMLGAVQKQWLFDKLLQSSATFKVIASSVPWAKGTKPGSLDTWDGHPNEREDIFNFIEKNKVNGVVLISADRHRSDARRISRPNGYDFYEFESSRLSNVHSHALISPYIFGYNKKCSFGILEFNTTKEDPHVVYRIFNIDNEEIHRLTVYYSELTF